MAMDDERLSSMSKAISAALDKKRDYAFVYRDTTDFVKIIVDEYDFYKEIIDLIKEGDTEIMLTRKRMSKTVDESWVKAIEDSIVSLDTIIRKPSRTIEENEVILPIELSRSITARSIQHLAQHTDYISKVEGDTVTPSKILNVYRDETKDTYENKFVNTLIDRLYIFIAKRYDQLFSDGMYVTSTHMTVKSSIASEENEAKLHFEVELFDKTDTKPPEDDEIMPGDNPKPAAASIGEEIKNEKSQKAPEKQEKTEEAEEAEEAVENPSDNTPDETERPVGDVSEKTEEPVNEENKDTAEDADENDDDEEDEDEDEDEDDDELDALTDEDIDNLLLFEDENIHKEEEKKKTEKAVIEKPLSIKDRVERIYSIINAYKESPFIREMGRKFVRPPIMRTNAITKNRDLRQCLELWEFIESYDGIGCEIDIQEAALNPDKNYIEELYSMLALQYVIFKYHVKTKLELERAIAETQTEDPLFPKIITEFNPFDVAEYSVYDVEYKKMVPVTPSGKRLSADEVRVRNAIDVALLADKLIIEREAARIAEEERLAILRAEQIERQRRAELAAIKRLELLRKKRLARKIKKRIKKQAEKLLGIYNTNPKKN